MNMKAAASLTGSLLARKGAAQDGDATRLARH